MYVIIGLWFTRICVPLIEPWPGIIQRLFGDLFVKCIHENKHLFKESGEVWKKDGSLRTNSTWQVDTHMVCTANQKYIDTSMQCLKSLI